MYCKKFKIFLTFSIFIACNNDFNYELLKSKIENVELNCVSLLEVNGVLYLSGAPYKGDCVLYDIDDSYEVKSYEEGKLNGIQIGYYPDGNVKYAGFRKDGEIHDSFIQFHPNGITQIKGQFKEGYYIGVFKWYNDEGKLIEKRKYNKYGILIDKQLFDL